jgi:hypothetical protein
LDGAGRMNKKTKASVITVGDASEGLDLDLEGDDDSVDYKDAELLHNISKREKSMPECSINTATREETNDTIKESLISTGSQVDNTLKHTTEQEVAMDKKPCRSVE